VKYPELKNKSIAELKELLANLRVELGKSVFAASQNTLKDFSQIHKTKRQIARVLNVLRAN